MKTKIRMLFFFLFFLVIQITNAKNIYVNDAVLTNDVYCTAVGNNTNSGLTAALPKLTLFAALGIAVNGDVIYVDAGLYCNSASCTDGNLTINKSVTIIGAGTALTRFSRTSSTQQIARLFATITANDVIIKRMELSQYAPSTTTSAQVIDVNGATGVVLDQLLITRNLGGADFANFRFYNNASVTVSNSFFKCSGFNASKGGGIYVENATAVINNTVFFSNQSQSRMGGALHVTGTSNVSVNYCNFDSNLSKQGGAIAINGGTLSVNNTCFSNNKGSDASSPTASDGGGAFFNNGGTATFSNCIFTNNCSGQSQGCANNGTVRGGALHIAAGTTTLNTCSFTNSQIADVSSGFAGADIHVRGGILNLENVFFNSVYALNRVNVDRIAGTLNWKDSGTPTTNGSGIAINNPETSGTINVINSNNPSGSISANCINSSLLTSCSTTVTCSSELLPPVIYSCVPNKTVACGTTLADYRSEVSAYDDCGFTVSQSPAAGTALSGTTTVTMTVRDPKLNTTTCTFTVTVDASTWNGSAWSNGTPTSSTAVTFTGDFSSTADLAACSVQVTNNAAVVINSGHNYTVQNAVTVDSGSTFTFNNNANLVQVNNVSNTGNIIMKRNTNLLKRLDYTIWSAPVAGQNLLAFSPLTLTNRFYTYNTATNLYNTVNPSTTSFTPGSGFQIRVPNDHPISTPTIWTGTFTGVPNNGPYNVTLSTATDGYNIVGNPYPSPINLSTFSSVNAANIGGTIWFWRKENSTSTNGIWTTWNGGTFVMAVDPGTSGLNITDNVARNGQGFLVKATSTTLSFTNAMRVGNTSNQFFRTDTSDLNRIWLNLTNTSGYFSQQAIRYSLGGTNDMDRMDAENINNSDVLFTSLRSNVATETNKFTIQSRQYPFDENDVVPLSVKFHAAGTYTIAIDHKDGLFQDGTQAIYLKDNLTNTEANLNNGSYSFVSDAGVFDTRFELKYVESALSNNQNNFENNVIVYQQNEIIHVNSSIEPIQNVKIFDIRGRLVHTADNINATSTNVKLNIENQVVLMRITLINGAVITRKILN